MSALRINQENENVMHFLTLTIIEWIDIFTKPEYFKVMVNSFKYCQKNKGLLLYEYVIMVNHVHMIARAEEPAKLSQIISDFKKHTTREILELLKKDNRRYILNLVRNSFARKKGYERQVWQRENFPETISSEKFLRQKIRYIYNNPVRKEYVIESEDWKYSSARNWISNDESVIELKSAWE